jgi:hypothetical protein
MAQAKGIRQVAWFDCPGGGQVVVERGMAYIGHMRNPHGTSIVDVSDPRQPRLVTQIEVPVGAHSHKVRVDSGLMLVNHEILNARVARGDQVPPGFRGGLGIHDISTPAAPRLLAKWEVTGTPGPSSGIHRWPRQEPALSLAHPQRGAGAVPARRARTSARLGRGRRAPRGRPTL